MRVEKSLRGVAVTAVPASRWPVVCALVIALLWSGAISASGPQTWQSRFGLIWPPACPVMVVETLLDFNKFLYSGRARHHGSAA
jgi:hypothetical protein